MSNGQQALAGDGGTGMVGKVVRVMDAFLEGPKSYTAPAMAAMAGLHEMTARRIMNNLADEGWLVKWHDGRRDLWRMADSFCIKQHEALIIRAREILDAAEKRLLTTKARRAIRHGGFVLAARRTHD